MSQRKLSFGLCDNQKCQIKSREFGFNRFQPNVKIAKNLNIICEKNRISRFFSKFKKFKSQFGFK